MSRAMQNGGLKRSFQQPVKDILKWYLRQITCDIKEKLLLASSDLLQFSLHSAREQFIV